ncbi:hypothetical protein [Pendulispora albinea]|uniref:D-glucuronyl C5-epimerase C-terminal domain-containing protein n=1 Tax=Pendulispora albinea TaxID=2741071 RepID=A0ABZ2LQK7_9BACT
MLSRRAFLGGSSILLLSRCYATASSERIPVELVRRSTGNGLEVVNLGLPLPPGLLDDARRIRVLAPNGRELPSVAREIEAWPLDASLRAAQVQTAIDFGDAQRLQIEIVTGELPEARRQLVPIEDTLLDPEGLTGPRVLPLLPAEWLCRSGVGGPQVPAARSGAYAAYDAAVERNFPGSLRYVDSKVFSTWLFDRPSTWYKQYVRTGDGKFLDAAYRAANFVRLQTELEGPDAGIFKLKGRDLKYVYPQSMHLHSLLTGDPRARVAADRMARFCLTRWDPWYRPERYTEPPVDVDPEQDRPFWTTRHAAISLLGIAHGWEMSGDLAYLRTIYEHINALYTHQRRPPDGHAADGSWRQNWALYDPSETRLPGATSPWMTAILVAALSHAWRITSDPRIPDMIVRWCEFLDRKGFQPSGVPYYVVDCLGADSLPAPPGDPAESTSAHCMEIAYSLAMGIYFTRDPEQRSRFRRRFDDQLARAVTLNLNAPPRAYNWAFHASSELVARLQSVDP